MRRKKIPDDAQLKSRLTEVAGPEWVKLRGKDLADAMARAGLSGAYLTRAEGMIHIYEDGSASGATDSQFRGMPGWLGGPDIDMLVRQYQRESEHAHGVALAEKEARERDEALIRAQLDEYQRGEDERIAGNLARDAAAAERHAARQAAAEADEPVDETPPPTPPDVPARRFGRR